ncbi:Kinesin-like protein KIF11, partial [Aduncisulcus paluster]
VAETFSNRASSRSHCIFTITTLIKETTRDGQELLKTAKLHLVDLAGSEGADACIGKDGKVNYQRKAESTKINLSLLTLGSVIRNIAEGNPHVPYLDSNLTKLLSESLGGRTFTCLIATVSLDAGSKEATKSTLQYAQMAKTIKNTPEQNERMTKKLVIKNYEMYDSMQLKGEEHAEQARQIEELHAELAQKEKEFAILQELFHTHEEQLQTAKKELRDATEKLQITSHELGEDF